MARLIVCTPGHRIQPQSMATKFSKLGAVKHGRKVKRMD
jgi:hypothetical protein